MFFVIFLGSLFQLILDLILSSKAIPFDSQKVDPAFVFAIDLEQQRFDNNPRFDIIFDSKMTPKFAKLVQNRLQNLIKPGPKNDPKLSPKLP